MADIYLNDTLTKEKRKFEPLKQGEVSMYNCGPTVYDYAHIGNFRTFITGDILRRMFEYNDLKVNQVMNVTDVDDKTIKRSQSEGVSLETLTRKYEDLFFEDLKSLNILKPTKTPRATESIPEMISLIEKLLEKGVAYKSTDGVYFDISKSEGYGKLANLNLESTTKERVANDEYDKENARDFSLWKFYSEDDGDVVYDAPFGKGRPGWHIECSAMAINNLGDTLDIHTGGSDLIFPHHTNEIAQSEAVTGKKFVDYWVHGGFITVDGKKMSKSLGNIFTLKDLKDKNIDPIAYRYFILGAHYSTILNFTWEAVEGAQTALKRLRLKINSLPNGGKIIETQFKEYIDDDLNTPKALALIWDILKDEKISDADKKSTIINFDKVLGLELDKVETFEIPDEVQNLIKERDLARNSKDFAKSDELRAKIEEFGFEVKDTAEGTVVLPR
ncbi:MAG: cysteine--tRNA ligase [Parcubacteria bacterium C7867-006]|nr:MAG: cysteine--tRNA ligase [Parcubacteria bacterium C7867-006]